MKADEAYTKKYLEGFAEGELASKISPDAKIFLSTIKNLLGLDGANRFIETSGIADKHDKEITVDDLYNAIAQYTSKDYKERWDKAKRLIQNL